MITKETISKIIDNEGFSENSTFTDIPEAKNELQLHNMLTTKLGVSQKNTESDVLNNYLLGEKHLNKLKRIDPNQKIIDAYDIDWDGYEINFKGITFKPKTTYELLDLIFRILNHLYRLHGDEDVVWNDNGTARSIDNYINWVMSDSNENVNDINVQNKYSSKNWETNS